MIDDEHTRKQICKVIQKIESLNCNNNCNESLRI